MGCRGDTEENRGKVYIVGAGPGDPSLITKRGLDLIRGADCILYDALAPVELLFYAKEEAELVPVGKKWGTTQSEINKLMEAKAREGKLVVRLKGGDPFIFGRGGEETEYLNERGIEFELVPGISALSAVPAYAGIPLTHRRLSSSICAVTCHEDPSKEEELNWRSVAELNGTLVLFMGAKNAREVKEKLTSSGMNGNLPFASITWGTTSMQRVTAGKLKELGEKGLEPPSLTVIGDVVELREKLSWFERKPLFGRNILVIRPKEEALELAERLREYGTRALIFPAIKFLPLDIEVGLLRDSLDSDWMVFTSKRGVRFFLQALQKAGLDVRRVRSRVAAIGAVTAEELRKVGILTDLLPDEYSSKGLLRSFARIGVSGKRISLMRCRGGNVALRNGLKELGAEVSEVGLYQTVPSGGREAEILRPLLSQMDTFIFTSPSCVSSFLETFGEEGRSALRKGLIVAIGPVTGKSLEEGGFTVDIMPDLYTGEGIVEEIVAK
ncbi:TPA: uroporphyrinogen-III C-methyltransferase [Candidatus Poribacteria bacterium]|nr:uroporphyrinogen-III C-methyltransferase [Candidatus Poribacteria bacterium]HEX30574.1 uroporphyrinogen-III C-methyltransferase [Candidatus Poribacteria bacterium]